MKKSITYSYFLALLLCINIPSQESVPGCSNLQASDFSLQEIITRAGSSSLATDNTITEPIQFDLDPISNSGIISSIDVYFVEREGKAKYFNSVTNTITEIGDFEVRARLAPRAGSDYGLMGIALDPDFKINNWIYLWWCPGRDENGTAYTDSDWKRMKLSRFTLTANKIIQRNTEKILLELLGAPNDHWHAGGPMTFDSYGDLWITVGNNSTDHQANSPYNHISPTDSARSDEWGASNTANLRGSILRIHPDDTAPNGYTIPEGNFGEYWAAYFESQGNSSLAAQYKDPVKMRPEIYTKGHRSNFSIAVHPTKRWLAYGDVNFESTRDEFTIANFPHFGGYPYFHGDMERTAGHNKSATVPVNNSALSSGIDTLPPVHEATFVNLRNVALSGPIYVYDSTLQSDVKFPPHFHEHWFKMSYSGALYVSKINQQGNGVVSNTTNELGGTGNLFSNLLLAAPISSKFGPDGAFYLMNYAGHYRANSNASGLYRFDYNGDCKPYKTPTISKSKNNWYSIKSGLLYVNQNSHSISLLNIRGKKIFDQNFKLKKIYSIQNWKKKFKLENGVYLLRLRTDNENITLKVWIH